MRAGEFRFIVIALSVCAIVALVVIGIFRDHDNKRFSFQSIIGEVFMSMDSDSIMVIAADGRVSMYVRTSSGTLKNSDTAELAPPDAFKFTDSAPLGSVNANVVTVEGKKGDSE